MITIINEENRPMDIFTSSEFRIAVDKCLEYIKKNKIKNIVSIYRGGLPFGVALSNKANIPLSIIEYQTIDGNTEKPNFILNKLEEGNVLLVDDIVDSGKTMEDVSKIKELKDKNLFYFTLVKRPGVDKKYISPFVSKNWVLFEDFE